MSNALFAILISFLISTAISPIIIKLATKLKARQTILHYVESHKSKSGTPTMGGLIFIIATIATCLIFFRAEKRLSLVALAIMTAYAVCGFLDDFIKIYYKRNEGLTARQKLIFQLAIALICGFFVYFNADTKIFIPFSSLQIDLKAWIIPFTVFFFLSCTNGVNLTDGLDGLASKVSLVFLLCFCAILLIATHRLQGMGEEQSVLFEYTNLAVFCAALSGALLAFLLFNSHPAKIFMGDTGSLALGAALGSVTVFCGFALIVPILGIMLVANTLSVIIQVAYFKRTKKRVFLMAPLHHHFEKKGMHETKIVAMYTIITAFFGLLTVFLTYIFF